MASKPGGCGRNAAAFLLLAGLAVWGIYSCNQRSEQARVAEQKRRDAMTPEQRAAEDKATADAKAAKDREIEIERLKIKAGSACKDYVRDCLKFPDDASFPWLDCDVTPNKQGDVFACEGTVKAKNGFGAQLTYRWAAIVWLDGDTWNLVNLTVNGQTMADHPELVAAIQARHGETPATEKPKKALPAEPKAEVRESDYRTWKDTKGHTIEAAFIQHKGANITLRKRDGKELSLSIYKLSDEDRDWIRQHGN